MSQFKEAINNWYNKTKEELSKAYVESRRKASGNWYDSIELQFEDTGENVKVKVLAANYTYWMEKGREPNQDQSHNALSSWANWASKSFIEQWCQDKGIRTVYAFPIAYKIARDGYQGKPFLDKVFTEENRNMLAKNIGNKIIVNFETDIVKLWQQQS